MKKISIAVVATIIVLIIITQISSIVITQNNENNGLGEALAYNNDPNNILDNVFTDILDDQNVIPFVFTKTTNFITKESIMNQFNRSGLTVTDIKTANGDFVGTGSEIYVEGAEKPYIILIYGDVNGDGQVNLIDAQ